MDRTNKQREKQSMERAEARRALEALNEARESIGLPAAKTPRPYILSAEEIEERFGSSKKRKR